MNGIVTGKVEKPSGSLEFKANIAFTVTGGYSAGSGYNYTAQGEISWSDFKNSFLKIVLTDETDKTKSTISYINISQIGSSSSGNYATQIHAPTSSGTRVLLDAQYASPYGVLRVQCNSNVIDKMQEDIEIGTLS